MKKTKSNKSWGGRFNKETNSMAENFTNSLDVDKRIYLEDIKGSIEYGKALNKAGILTRNDLKKIISGLKSIQKEIELNKFKWLYNLEDVHMNIESALVKKIGNAGKKIHTGRSRNDQVATDLKLYLKELIKNLQKNITKSQIIIASLAEKHHKSIMPGFTHMQIAQPITLGHHLLAWFEMLQRDYERFADGLKRMDEMPLGSAALSGSRYKIDRSLLAKKLGFARITKNSLDAVSDRDFLIEIASSASILGVHLSRFCEELVLWSSSQFNYVDIGEEFCTGSSIMPQKKNPDVAEIIRGRSSRNISSLLGLLTLMKNLPLSYNRDMQEDKAYIFNSLDNCIESLDIFSSMLKTVKINKAKMKEDCYIGHITATDLADYLVMKDIPFRKSHEIVGKAVAYAEDKGVQLFELNLNELKKFSKLISSDVYNSLDPNKTIYLRNKTGGTSPDQVLKASRKAKEVIKLRQKK
ncbi:MAG: argininosuccinate lyase [SAR86 cluster bacterium]|jgi:argininosuccinate lyase|nr:argininosuccinate lyase [SAR86 cluster bacterium]